MGCFFFHLNPIYGLCCIYWFVFGAPLLLLPMWWSQLGQSVSSYTCVLKLDLQVFCGENTCLCLCVKQLEKYFSECFLKGRVWQDLYPTWGLFPLGRLLFYYCFDLIVWYRLISHWFNLGKSYISRHLFFYIFWCFPTWLFKVFPNDPSFFVI